MNKIIFLLGILIFSNWGHANIQWAHEKSGYKANGQVTVKDLSNKTVNIVNSRARLGLSTSSAPMVLAVSSSSTPTVDFAMEQSGKVHVFIKGVGFVVWSKADFDRKYSYTRSTALTEKNYYFGVSVSAEGDLVGSCQSWYGMPTKYHARRAGGTPYVYSIPTRDVVEYSSCNSGRLAIRDIYNNLLMKMNFSWSIGYFSYCSTHEVVTIYDEENVQVSFKRHYWTYGDACAGFGHTGGGTIYHEYPSDSSIPLVRIRYSLSSANDGTQQQPGFLFYVDRDKGEVTRSELVSFADKPAAWYKNITPK